MSSADKLSNAKHIKARPMMNYQKTLNILLSKKYLINPPYYNSILINDIIFNEKTHLVAIFKDNLINDDESEFLKRYYNRNEVAIRLPRFFVYYDSYSRIFPNYTALNESKFIYKNIHKKQKMIDLQQENSNKENNINANSQTKQQIKKKEKEKDNEMNNGNSNDDKSNRMFNTEVYTSIINNNEDIALIFDLTKNNNQEDKVEEGEQIDDLVNRISILEIRNESVIECPSMKSSIIHNKENSLCDTRYSLSKQSSINFASNTSKKHFQSPDQYSQHQFSIKQIESKNCNRKQSGSDLRNNSNDHIFINRLRNDKQNNNINNLHSLSQLSTTIQPQITPKYYPSLRPQTHREEGDGSNNNAESTKVNSNYLLESNYKTQNAMRIRTKFRLGNNYKLDTSQLKKNKLDQIKDNKHCLYFNSKAIEPQLDQISLRIIRNSSDKDRNDNKDSNNKTATCRFSPFSSSHSTKKSSSIMNGKKIYYRNNQESSQMLHHCNNDNNTVKSVGKTNMFCKVVTKDKVFKGNRMNNINEVSSKDKDKNFGLNGGITSRASSKTVRQMNFDNALSFRHMSYKNDKGIKIRNPNQLAVSTNLKQLPLQNIMQGIQIKHFSKAIHLIETPNKRASNSDRSMKNKAN